MDHNLIDLNQAEQAVSQMSTTNEQQDYQSRTLGQHNSTRTVYLPLYPTKSFGPNDCLLLANIPVTRLTPQEIARRQHGAYTSDAILMMNDYKYSNDGFTLMEQDVEDLTAHLLVGKSIVTFNADRLRGICYYFLALHGSFRRKVLKNRDRTLKNPVLNSKQMAILLEFYLQIDVDLFYMKTCSFRGAEPKSIVEGLFCGKHEPRAKYKLLACGNIFCRLCHPINHSKKSQPWPVIDFNSSSMHQFLNGYTTYLNCPATCSTSNIIYSMTCPCGHYDYVDSTVETLSDAMTNHREHGNRIIHEALVGSRVYRASPMDPTEKEKEIANKMRLYHHSARCPVALRSFLDCNPIYWCFIPQRLGYALAENALHLRHTSTITTTTTTTIDPEHDNIIAMGTTDNNLRVVNYLEHVPTPPDSYAFSRLQRQNQRLFFQQFVSSSIHQLPYSKIDLYKMAIIVVLPHDCSTLLRYIIETLFVLHGETKLNMICPLGGDPYQRYGPPHEFIWCNNLAHPSLSSHSCSSSNST
ncbi:unnamed protein product [Adineta steineri]|uniref:Uncharacterized protein n=1 Tax=Adineta steineri TaxID=433720 RepID=A0A815RQU2_9BILA|nr:unnamed protein product [Adineta steineri]CAF1481666.1 unnamed protein product [Adineta steineri]CAF1618515.1 unnamed protein product [Adineta steineri]CAF1618560.1 unnamed protein product [Adineta steineri]